MADLAISYAHNSSRHAVALRDSLIGAGFSVWMDAPGDDDGAIVGIPVGQSHWAVIERELASALVVVALDTQDWREREYCQREYRLCRNLGKPIEFVSPAEIEERVQDIARSVNGNAAHLAAHARLAARVVTPQQTRESWIHRVLFGRSAGDATTVIEAREAPFMLTPAVREVADADLARAEAGRRQFRRAMSSVVAGFTGIALVASVAWLFSGLWSRAASDDRARAEALELSSRASSSVDTVQALAMARQAASLDSSPRISDALAAAERRDRRMRVIELPPDTYRGAAWSADEDLVYAYSHTSVVTIDPQTGDVSDPVRLDHRIRTGTAVASSITGFAYVDTTNQLRTLDMRSGVSSVMLDGVSTLALGVDETLVASGRAGSVLTLVRSPEGLLDVEHSLPLPAHARSIDVDGQTIGLIDDDGWLRTVNIAAGGLTLGDSVQVGEGSLAESGSWVRSTVTVCGDSLAGSFVPSLMGSVFEWDLATGELVTERSVQQVASVCSPEGALTATFSGGEIQEQFGGFIIALPSGVEHVWSVRDPHHARAAFISSVPGRLVVVDPAAAVTARDIGVSQLVLPFTEATLSIGDDGAVVDLESAAPHGRIPGTPVFWAIQGCNALVQSWEGSFHVGCDADAELVREPTATAGLRPASDGERFVVTRQDGVEIRGADGSLERDVLIELEGQSIVVEADLSPDGSMLLLAKSDGSIVEADVDGVGEPVTIAAVPSSWATLVAYRPDGSVLVLGADSRLRLYDLDRELASSVQLDIIGDFLLVDDDEILVTSLEGGAVLLDSETMRILERLDQGVFFASASPQDPRLGLLVYSYGAGVVSSSSLLTTPRVDDES
ncbi:MAG: toll/interleukin-1 receptor domain-containing protein [Actinobacteria bacterium]|nr:toll/interleukin-1 receptor domain-containing protein [Actinomycetota bacterium]